MKKAPSFKDLTELLQSRHLILDGGMGTMIQSYKLEEPDFRNEALKNHYLKRCASEVLSWDNLTKLASVSSKQKADDSTLKPGLLFINSLCRSKLS
jgi:hypothetical protein